MINIVNNENLAVHTTMQVGGPARYFVTIASDAELREALAWAREKKIPVFILGGGSNIIFTDEGFAGLVIKTQLEKLVINEELVTVESGVLLKNLIAKTLEAGLVGMEFAAGIPGTVGGAIRGNAGTFGVDTSSVVETVTYVNLDDTKSYTIQNNQCDFRYRHSFFKTNSYFITSATLRLHKGDANISKKIIDERIATRIERHPTEPSAGCIFKNIAFKDVNLHALIEKGLEIDRFKEYQKIPAGFLIESLGLKGKKIGDAKVAEKHANYIINSGHATAEQIIELISYLKQQIRDAYGVQLEEEVQIVYKNPLN